MPIPLDTTEFENEDDATYTGADLLPAGTYHAELIEVDDQFDERELITLNFQALAGTTPGQEGKCRKAFLDFSRDENAKDPNWRCEKSTTQAQQLAVVFGLKRLDEKKTIDFEDALHRQCIVSFEEATKTDAQGRPYVNYVRAYSSDNPEVANVPRADVPFDPAVNPTQPVSAPSSSAAVQDAAGTTDEDNWDL